MKKILILIVVIILVAGSFYIFQRLSPKNVSPIETNPSVSSVDDLYDKKAEFIGSASDVGNLIHSTNIPKLGEYTMELQSEKEPYGLILNVKNPIDLKNPPFDMEKEAAKVIALVKNLDYLIYDDNKVFLNYNHKELSEKFGFDIKEAFEDKGKLVKIIEFKNDSK